uniref:Profilin n=1 Tax=Latimeria chalumnae TaxID=7897 RepID=H3BAP9_LATCH
MSSWQAYITCLLEDGLCRDAAVVAISPRQILAARKGGLLEQMTAEEIDTILGPDRRSFFTQGLTIGGKRCSVIRDNLLTKGDHTMDIRIKWVDKDNPGYSLALAKANRVFIIIQGKRGIHGGTLNKKAFQMADYIRNTGC